MKPDEPTVYIVDDDESVLKAARRLFVSEGLNVLTFRSAQEFLDFPVSEGPACLILDYQLPEISGLAVQELLQQRDVSCPVVFMSGRGDIPTSVTAMKQGAVDFLPKPVDNDVLLQTVKNAIHDHAEKLSQQDDVDQFRKRLETLTQREREVYFHVIEGLLNKQIANRLGITEATVKVHRGRMMEKMGVDSLAAMARLHERAGIQSPT